MINALLSTYNIQSNDSFVVLYDASTIMSTCGGNISASSRFQLSWYHEIIPYLQNDLKSSLLIETFSESSSIYPSYEDGGIRYDIFSTQIGNSTAQLIRQADETFIGNINWNNSSNHTIKCTLESFQIDFNPFGPVYSKSSPYMIFTLIFLLLALPLCIYNVNLWKFAITVTKGSKSGRRFELYVIAPDAMNNVVRFVLLSMIFSSSVSFPHV